MPITATFLKTPRIPVMWNSSRTVGINPSCRTKRCETSAELTHKRLRLLPRGEVATLGQPVVAEQLGIRAHGPALRGLIDLVRIRHDRDRDLNAAHVEEAALAAQLLCGPIEPRRGD